MLIHVRVTAQSRHRCGTSDSCKIIFIANCVVGIGSCQSEHIKLDPVQTLNQPLFIKVTQSSIVLELAASDAVARRCEPTAKGRSCHRKTRIGRESERAGYLSISSGRRHPHQRAANGSVGALLDYNWNHHSQLKRA